MQQETELLVSPGGIDAENRRPSGLKNWALALSTIPVAAFVMLFAVGQAMGSIGCTDELCRHTGPGESWFSVLCYGAPVVALVTIGLSFFTAKKRFGIVVPLTGLALLGIEIIILSMTFGP